MISVQFILVDPARSGNIGSAARAINTMGFDILKLVRPGEYMNSDARKMAYGSHDILEKVTVFDTLEQALEGVDLAVATTSKNRTVWNDYFTPQETLELVKSKGSTVSTIALVFGSEENGLSKEDLELCDIRSTVPLAKPYPSINLAQSVMIYAHIFSSVPQNDNQDKVATDAENRLMLDSFGQLLKDLEIDRNPNLYRRMMERLALCNEDDTHLMLSFHKHLRRKLTLSD